MAERTCVGCRKISIQQALIRFVSDRGKLRLDSTRDAPGRGCWLHPRLDCFELALQRKAFARALRAQIEIDEQALRSEMELSRWQDDEQLEMSTPQR